MHELAKALKTSCKVVPDEYGDLSIYGKRSKLYKDDTYWYVYIAGRWEEAKEKLNFMEVWQDGDLEGVLRMKSLPNTRQAKSIRSAAKLGKKREWSEAQYLSMQKYFFKAPTAIDSVPKD